MQIQSNIPSMFAQRQLGQSSMGIAVSLQRLSTGLRINSAKDDAAGMAISERMTAQIRGSTQAKRNANDAISMLTTAEGAAGNAVGILQRMRELAVQAANGTNSNLDRQALQSEIEQSISAIDNIGSRTSFNGQLVFSQATDSIVGDPNEVAVLDNLANWVGAALERINTYYGLQGDGASLSVNLYTGESGSALASVSWTATDMSGKALNLSLNLDMLDFTPVNPPNGGTAPVYNDRIITHEMVHAVMGRTTNIGALPNWFVEGAAEFIHGADERVLSDSFSAPNTPSAAKIDAIRTAFTADDVSGSAGYSAGYLAMRFVEKNIAGGVQAVMTRLEAGDTLDAALNTASGGTYANAAALKTAVSTSLTTVYNVANGGGTGAAVNASYLAEFGVDLSNADTGAIGGADASGGAALDAASVIPDSGVVSGFSLEYPDVATGSPGYNQFAFQMGYEGGNQIAVNVGAMNAATLGIERIDLVGNAQGAMGALDRAINYVSSERAKLGAQMSRFESVVAQLDSSVEAASASRSRIIDADFASETAALTRHTILQQAGVAMLAQANSAPNMVLSLLR